MQIPNPFSNIHLYPKTLFQKVFTLAAFCLCGMGILAYTYQHYCSPVITSSKVGDRHLPIYCVDCGDEKKIALSFDAAWGDGRGGKSLIMRPLYCILISLGFLYTFIKHILT